MAAELHGLTHEENYMSWSVTVGHVPYDQSHDDNLIRSREDALRQNPECGDQYDAALAATVAMIQSGSLGSSSHTFRVSMNGHSNPGHGPRAGYSNDAINISIYQEKMEDREPQT
jgi:hypothetical protein